MKIIRKINFAIIFIITFFQFNSNAYAYLDPGTGSIILQAIIAFFAGATAFVSLYWRKFKNYISNLFSKNKKKE